MISLKQAFNKIFDAARVRKNELETQKKEFDKTKQDYIDTINDLKKEIERLNNRRFSFVVTFEDGSKETIQADGFKDYEGILSFYANVLGLFISHEHDVYATKKRWINIKEIETDV